LCVSELDFTTYQTLIALVQETSLNKTTFKLGCRSCNPQSLMLS
jgi:hypothetical protein